MEPTPCDEEHHPEMGNQEVRDATVADVTHQEGQYPEEYHTRENDEEA
jgi:hypothetical protein